MRKYSYLWQSLIVIVLLLAMISIIFLISRLTDPVTVELPLLSHDGQFIAFDSNSKYLLMHSLNLQKYKNNIQFSTDKYHHIFIYNLHTCSLNCVYFAPNGNLFTNINLTQISNDGRYICFEGIENIPSDTNHIYLYDNLNKIAFETDFDSNNKRPDSAYDSMMSKDRIIVASDAIDCLNTNVKLNTKSPAQSDREKQQIYINDINFNKIQLIDGYRLEGINDNGRYLLIDFNPVQPCLYRFDRIKGSYLFIHSLSNDFMAPNKILRVVTINSDGRYIAFSTRLSKYRDIHASNDFEKVYLFDCQTGITKCVSISNQGQDCNNASGQKAVLISADGRYIVFDSIASNLDSTYPFSARILYRHDCLTGKTISICPIADTLPESAISPVSVSMSADGRYLAISDTKKITIKDLLTNESKVITPYRLP